MCSLHVAGLMAAIVTVSPASAGGVCEPWCDDCWQGTPSENNCPLGWMDDGRCDCGCQFADIDDCCQNGCDDGLACTGAETCDPVTGCQHGVSPCTEPEICCDTGGGSFVCCQPYQTCFQGYGCWGCLTDADCGDDGRFCNVEACWEGGCISYLNCDDGIWCTDDECDEEKKECSHVYMHQWCGDQDACNGIETCDPENGPCSCCIPGDPNYDCSPAPRDADCPAGYELYCSDCALGEPPDCDDGIDCTVDECDPQFGCLNTPDYDFCEDGVFCNGLDWCSPAEGCIVFPTCPTFQDGCVLRGVGCIEEEDSCIDIPDDSLCGDDLACNGPGFCDPYNGDCYSVPVVCPDDGLICTVEDCEEDADAPDGYRCVPRLLPWYCLIDGQCFAQYEGNPLHECQRCFPEVNPNDWRLYDLDCDDNADCTQDICLIEGCANNPVSCDDGVFCNGVEECAPCPEYDRCCFPNGTCFDDYHYLLCWIEGGTPDCLDYDCVPGTLPNCNDNIPCTVDSCDLIEDRCVNTPNHHMCADGVYCNGPERCVPAVGCRPGLRPCPPSSCNEATDTCRRTTPSLRGANPPTDVKTP